MTEQVPTLGIAAKAWWALTWRSLLCAVVVGTVWGFVIGIIASIAGWQQGGMTLLAGVGGFFLGAYVSIRIMRRLMIKGFGRYRLSVVEK